MQVEAQRARVRRVFARMAVRFRARWTSGLETDEAYDLAVEDWLPEIARMSETAITRAFAEMADGPRDWPPGPVAFRKLGAGVDPVAVSVRDPETERQALVQAAARDPVFARVMEGAKRIAADGGAIASVEAVMDQLRRGVVRRSGAVNEQVDDDRTGSAPEDPRMRAQRRSELAEALRSRGIDEAKLNGATA